LQESNENAQKAIDDSIKGIKGQTEFIPFLNERKMELEATHKLIDSAGEAEIDEGYSKLLPFQKRDEQHFTELRGLIGNVHMGLQRAQYDTSGTGTAYIDFAYSLAPTTPFKGDIGPSVTEIFKDVTIYKAHKEEIPQKLSLLNSDLGKMFSLVHDNYEKAKSGVMTVKQAVSDMRDVLNKLWGNLAELSFTKDPEKWRGINKKLFRKSSHRQIVSECLIDDLTNRGKFKLLLDFMYTLYGEMSDTAIGKNPLSQDYPKLDEFFTRWISQIDGIIGMLELKI
jgi:hypothetical protein